MKRVLAGFMAVVLLLTNVTYGESVYAKSATDEHAQTLSIGENHSGAITEDGSLYMWGSNYSGELGDGTTENKLSPVKVLDDVTSLSLGLFNSAAITKDGSLYMWGYNNCGQLGDGTEEDKSSPVKVLDDVVSVSLGGRGSGAITEDGSLYMWGLIIWDN